MPFDPSQDPSADPLVSQPRRAPPALVVAGVAGACLLGGALGYWARPSSDGVELLARRAASAPPAASPRQIEIRVDRPPPVAAEPAPPVEVAPPPQPAAPEPAPTPELLAPKRPPEGLVKVHAVAPQRLVDVEEVSERKARAAAERRALAKAEAEALAARKAKAEKAAREAAAREARAEAKAAAVRKAKAEAAQIAEAAEAKARARAAERRLAERKAAEKLAAREAAAEKRQARLAAEKKATRKLAEEQRKTAPKAVAAASPPPARTTAAKASTRCASPDPGEALACSDPALGAAERQLSRAYRQAEAAGVPPETLERQQRRWLAARANAARKAPWAVHDIYLARIAELQDQTRQAAAADDF